MSHNVFADMGLRNPEEELRKAHLVNKLSKAITEKGMVPEEAAYRLNLNASALSALLDGVWDDYSADDLLRFNDTIKHAEKAKTLTLTV